MNEDIKKRYLKFRALGWAPLQALRAAKLEIEFFKYARQGLVRIKIEPEQESYWDVYGTEGYSKKDIEQVNKLLERDGLWWACAEARLNKKEPWEQGDSIGMLIGTDNYLDGYEPDLWASALEVLDRLFQEEADELALRGTYAAGSAA